MVLKLYNTLTRTEEEFKPLHDNQVTMYSCGPTVYDYAHIGNWRSFIINDLLRRVLEFNKLHVRHVMNITDIDDKTINGSQKADESLGAYTKKYEEIFLADADKLNLELGTATKIIRATENVAEMIALIEKLLVQDQAYKTSDGIYFKVASFANYGKLSKQPIDDNAERDFALWKFQAPTDGEVGWEAPFGKGRPGWHIECSAMSLKTLGDTLDIHTGGTDLTFPHHENEIAQSESVTCKPFARFWIHIAFLLVNGEKMSKSLGNFHTLRDIEAKGSPPLVYRYWVLTAHYRSQVNFTWESLGAAQVAVNKIYDFYRELGEEAGNISEPYRSRFTEALNNDLNTSQALAIVWELIKDQNVSPADKKATLLEFDKVLGLNLTGVRLLEIPTEIQQLANQRETARQEKNWPRADQLRQEIESKGFEILDTDTGPRLKPK